MTDHTHFGRLAGFLGMGMTEHQWTLCDNGPGARGLLGLKLVDTRLQSS